MELGLDSFRAVASGPSDVARVIAQVDAIAKLTSAATPSSNLANEITEANHVLSQLEAIERRLAQRLFAARSGMAGLHLQAALGHARAAALVVRYGLGVALECALRPSPECGHNACSQHYIETGEAGCVEGSTALVHQDLRKAEEAGARG